ncbi:all-trans retinoic acid-induced differentiation factor isoform X2 [Falco naumanni]|uniref:all-trans retinoic acid-induced differentiation factor isoform X2 n=1 Tax=Falco naumanni TaxID=148594 RepID=UPI001ADE7016|nr:all-trans retinoic acid-induced differentiation factor isoform X2 [Falco naumanni]
MVLPAVPARGRPRTGRVRGGGPGSVPGTVGGEGRARPGPWAPSSSSSSSCPGPPVARRLDLSDCSLRSLPPGLAEAAAAIVLDLTENPLTTLPNGSFLGFTHLERLAVPLALDCPGGSSAWEEVKTHGSSRLCQGQRNPCNSSRELDWPCPDNAACAPDGPGLIQCLCDRPFHGYKCLREGTFPTLLFCGILGAATLSLSLLLWRTQRWKAKTP